MKQMIHLLSILVLAVMLLICALLLAVILAACGTSPSEWQPAPPRDNYTFSNGMQLDYRQLIDEYERAAVAGQYAATSRLALRVNQAGLTPRPPEAQQAYEACRPRAA